MTTPSKPLTPSPEPSPKMMERARKFWAVEHPDEDHTGCNGGKGCSLYVLALAFSGVAREARDAERERCAGIADHLNAQAAAAIRAPKPEPTE